MVGDMAVGAIAQLTAGVVFTPVDVIKERMQVCFWLCTEGYACRWGLGSRQRR